MQTRNDTSDVSIFATILHPVTTQLKSEPPNNLCSSLCDLSVPKHNLPPPISHENKKKKSMK
jgi:hypothetical protein